MAVSLGLSITQNSQNTTAKTSNVTVTLTIYWTTSSYNGNSPSGTLYIDGVAYPFTSNFNYAGIGQGPSSVSGSTVACVKTVDVAHNSDGTKTLYCSASFASGTLSGTVSTSASKVLTTIGGSGSGSGGDSGDSGWNYVTEINCIVGEHSSIDIDSGYKKADSTCTLYYKANVLYTNIPVVFKADEGYEPYGCYIDGVRCDEGGTIANYNTTIEIISGAAAASYGFSMDVRGGASVIVNRTSSERGSTGPLSNGDTIYHNDVLTITVEANPGYELETFTVNGSDFASGDSITVSGDLTIAVVVANLAGSAYIEDGTTFTNYTICIDNGTNWDTYVAYIDNGSDWDLYT